MLRLFLIVFFIVLLYPAKAVPDQNADHLAWYLSKIRANNPHIDSDYALKLAKTIRKASIKHGIRADKLIGILMQESSYRLSIRNKTGDYSIGQINIRTIKHYKLDKKRLLNDLDYSVDASAMILADLKDKYDEEDYWTRYHSFTPKLRAKYKKLVMRYM
jgi:hypothetical protein